MCTTLLHRGNRLHPKNVSVLFAICCSRVVDAHPGRGVSIEVDRKSAIFLSSPQLVVPDSLSRVDFLSPALSLSFLSRISY